MDRKLISKGGRPSAKTDEKTFTFLLQSLMSSSYYGFVGSLECIIDLRFTVRKTIFSEHYMITSLATLITLLRIPYLCHFGSTSFVLPIWTKYGILNGVIRVARAEVHEI